MSVCDGGDPMALQIKVDMPGWGACQWNPNNRQQAINSPEWEEWRKAEEVKMHGMINNCVFKQVARPKDRLLVRSKMLYKGKI